MHDSGSIPCDGWWAQDEIGRHEMEGLRLTISATRIAGSGVDVVGAFRLDGTRASDGRVRLVKQYLGQHAVGYAGHFDGQTRLAGTWRLEGMRGPWEIVLRHPLEASEVRRATEPAEARAAAPTPTAPAAPGRRRPARVQRP